MGLLLESLRRGRSAALVIAAVTVASAPAFAAGAKFMPPDDKILVIVGQDVANVSDYLAKVKIPPAGVAAYTSVMEVEGLSEPADHGGGVQFAQKLLEESPNSVLQLAVYMVDACQKVAAGDLDEEIDRMADWIKAARRPVFLRLGYEFDFPENGYEPADYVAAYRHIVDRFRSRGVTNVAYVWHSYASVPHHPEESWYPGDDYVDWFAISYFRQPRSQLDAVARLALKHQKPLMIAEASPISHSLPSDRRAWAAWFQPLFQYARSRHVRAISYIGCDWDKTALFESKRWGDTRIQSSADIKTRWVQEISKPEFLNASPDLFGTLGYKP